MQIGKVLRRRLLVVKYLTSLLPARWSLSLMFLVAKRTLREEKVRQSLVMR